MEPITIRVRGSHTTSVPAERGTVRVQIRLESDDLGAVMAAVTDGQTRLLRSIDELHDKRQGPVTWYAVDQLSTYSWTPHDRDNQPLLPRHQVSISAEVKFSDFAALALWVRKAVDISGFSVDGVQWALTAKRRSVVETKAQQRAVLDARTRAQNYADALDLGAVKCRALSDPGLGFVAPGVTGSELLLDRSYGGSPPESHGDLVPRAIEVRAEVEAEFVLHP
ncbi:MAG: SIMPL domain-containing protein [Propionibacteriales bacterium]|nr:SIMPL domain-containing protein [Propionibacteriales bacterium]